MAEATLTIQVAAGPSNGPITLTASNGSIQDLLEAARDTFNIPVGVTPLVNGEPVDDDGFELSDGDEVSFNKAAGEKG